jgi:hypothetical protein
MKAKLFWGLFVHALQVASGSTCAESPTDTSSMRRLAGVLVCRIVDKPATRQHSSF